MRLRAELRTGRRPSIVLHGFPAGTSKVEFQTGGVGDTSTGAAGPCRHRERRYSGAMRITLSSHQRKAGQAHGGVACGTGAPEAS